MTDKKIIVNGATCDQINSINNLIDKIVNEKQCEAILVKAQKRCNQFKARVGIKKFNTGIIVWCACGNRITNENSDVCLDCK